uniref:Uncharacterized protein n=1 Tax=Arundo donax TaxID=35708 RepID=A0A0A9GLW0_ARUDO
MRTPRSCISPNRSRVRASLIRLLL